MSGSMGMKFPKLENHGHAEVSDRDVTFSYLDSLSRSQTQTRPLLDADGVLELVRQRMSRFAEAPPGARESDLSRSDRKYVSAQPIETLHDAWEAANDEEKMELFMMLDENTHSGISDPSWLEKHEDPQAQVPGDNGPLDAEANRSDGDLTNPDEGGLPIGPPSY